MKEISNSWWSGVVVCALASINELKGQLQRKFFISTNELLLHQITIYVIKSL